ncbi:transcriptional adaptor 3 [Arctopsyche grandis]|uniref:transcriptional adaptor 3 n=1 Tax=Arctopsyche grandis TaxID=121162 RepID=UPI00406D9425
MLGKRISQSSKGRIVNKGHEGGKPSSPGMSAYTKPVKMQPAPVVNKFRETPTIPYIKLQDTATTLPKYMTILSRSTEEGIGMDELDFLQNELENLLCTAALRTRVFQSEIENIDVNESKREKKGKAAGKQLQYPGKRKYQDEKSAKPKESSKSSATQPKLTKFKNFTPIITPVPSQGSFSHDNILMSDNTVKLEMPSFASLPKNNTPYKFWTSVEPYCGPITGDDIKYAETLLATSNNMPPPTIPPLGKHYSEVWADEHLSDDQLASNPYKHKSSGISSDASLIRKKGEKTVDCGVTGPLTQRLVSALMEDNSIQFESPDTKVKQSLNKSNNFRNSIALERCLRKELIEQGILDPEDLPPLTNPADDEILTDIKKCLAELAILKKTNVKNLRNLLSMCKQEMVRNNLKKQLEQVDAECTEIYKKHLLAKQKKRPLTKKEKEDAWRAINEQIRLNNEINELPITGPNSG